MLPMKLSYKTLRNPIFMDAIRVLYTHPKYESNKVSYQVAKLAKTLDEEFRISQELFVKLINQYADRNDAGELVRGPQGQDFIITDDTRKKLFIDEQTTFLNHTVDLSTDLKFSDIEHVPLSPAHMDLLGDFFDGHDYGGNS